MLTFHLVKRAGFVQLYKLDEVKLCRVLQALEAGYQRDNPYHNRSEPGGLSTTHFNYAPVVFVQGGLA